jgi:hypothetical protein
MGWTLLYKVVYYLKIALHGTALMGLVRDHGRGVLDLTIHVNMLI